MLRKWYSKLGLRTKVSSIALAITSFSLAVVATAGMLQTRSQISAQEHRSADSVAQGIARAAELALTVGDQKELGRLTASFLRDPNILFIAAYGKGDQPIASAVRNQSTWNAYLHNTADDHLCILGEQIVQGTVQPDEFTNEEEFELVAGPATAAKPAAPQLRTIGRVVVGMSTAPAIEAQMRENRATMAATAVAAIVGATVLFFTLGSWMRRLQRLANASQAISRGDFTGSIEDRHDDEIGRLAQSFDDMRLALRKRDIRLRDFTETLQAQVAERTKDLQHALTAAEEANRAKSLFLANMSHELRTPLNGVIGMVDLLLGAEPNVQQRRYCEIAKSSARSLLELINDILDFSKIEAGKLELDSTDFDLHDLLEGVTQMFGERAEKKGIELGCSVGRDVPRAVTGDPVRLRQVILNLVSNAIKFTESGEVVISVAVNEQNETKALLKFAIKDSGIGIPQHRLDRLFKSFSQVDTSTTRKFGGTGLGLAISQRIVELMGGRIGVQSEEGKGSVFWFSVELPLREAASTPRREADFNPRGLRALAVDDNQTNREILQAQLASWSLRADVAGSAAQAMEMLNKAAREGDPYRFAILDMHMPKTDGLELAREIKTGATTRDLILISLSSISDQLRADQMNQLGFSACLTKPVLPSQLYNAIVDSLAVGERAIARSANRVLPEPELTRLNGVRILLAEDNEVNRLVASELLQQVGCDCTVVVNGREALDEALRNEYDAILMDCQMPELDGFETTRLIRESEKATGNSLHRLIIALTANAIKGDRELCVAAGMDGYVTKPIDPAELFQAIRSLLPAARSLELKLDTPPVEDSAAVQPVSVEPPIDVESLLRRCMGNQKIAAKALGMFANTVERDVKTLTQSVLEQNPKVAAGSAHKIKGAAANASVNRVRDVAADLEKLAKSDSLSQSQACLDRLEREMASFREYVATAIAQLTPPEKTERQPT
jgi:signal transduction histidine kinase/CheY-like chemotaxis protein/HPt (histidine-containing phosphotransfer) domain-containing protein